MGWWAERRILAPQEGRRSRAVSRAVAFLAACAIQLLAGLALVLAWRSRNAVAPVPSGIVTQVILVRRPAEIPTRVPRRWAYPIRGFGRPTRLELKLPRLNLPALERHRRSQLKWFAAARTAAHRVVEAQALAHRYRPGSGKLPPWWKAAWGAPKTRPTFPWSRQPLSPWFDVSFDRHNGVTTIRIGRRCRILLLGIDPFFACFLGHLNPDPGRGDLFDRKYLPAPLVLPKPDLAPARPASGPVAETRKRVARPSR